MIRDVIKDTEEQLDGELHGARSRRVPGAGASVPGGWGAPPSQHVNVSTSPEALHTPQFEEFVRLHSAGTIDRLLTPSPAPEDGGRKFQDPNHGRSCWDSLHPEDIQEPTKSPHIRKKDAPIVQEIPRALGTLLGTQIKGQIVEQRTLLTGAETKHILLIVSHPMAPWR